MSNKEILIYALEYMLSGNIDKGNGICENLDIISGREYLGYHAVEKFSNNWEHFSGEETYPISGRTGWCKILDEGRSFWDGEQGELRMSLLEHIKSEVLKLSNEEFDEVLK